MKEIGIILISHGHFAEYAMKSAEMIVGKQEKYKIVSVTDDKDSENVLEELREAYKELKPVLKNDNVDVQKGINIVMEALLSPICQIAENAGYNSEDIVDMQKSAAKNQGFDAKNGEWVDMFDKGIIDPTKVTRSALLNAASISALFITTEAGVAEIKSETPEAPMMPNQMY